MISVNTKSITGFKLPMSYGEKDMVYFCVSVSIYRIGPLLLPKQSKLIACSVLHGFHVMMSSFSPIQLGGKFKPASVLQTCDKLPPIIKLKKPKWRISRISTGASFKVRHFLWLDTLRLISEKVPACSL